MLKFLNLSEFQNWVLHVGTFLKKVFQNLKESLKNSGNFELKIHPLQVVQINFEFFVVKKSQLYLNPLLNVIL